MPPVTNSTGPQTIPPKPPLAAPPRFQTLRLGRPVPRCFHRHRSNEADRTVFQHHVFSSRFQELTGDFALFRDTITMWQISPGDRMPYRYECRHTCVRMAAHEKTCPITSHTDMLYTASGQSIPPIVQQVKQTNFKPSFLSCNYLFGGVPHSSITRKSSSPTVLVQCNAPWVVRGLNASLLYTVRSNFNHVDSQLGSGHLEPQVGYPVHQRPQYQPQ
ncbi:hypothetical protein V8C42DRAFT_173108 [Trichoderma barbatum]